MVGVQVDLDPIRKPEVHTVKTDPLIPVDMDAGQGTVRGHCQFQNHAGEAQVPVGRQPDRSGSVGTADNIRFRFGLDGIQALAAGIQGMGGQGEIQRNRVLVIQVKDGLLETDLFQIQLGIDREGEGETIVGLETDRGGYGCFQGQSLFRSRGDECPLTGRAVNR